ncbi:MAG: AAA family ATPase [Lachnospiraceae bacterium]|jgi:DNA-binding SARP family transcriptional activator
MESIFVHLLGTPHVEQDGVPIAFPYKKMEALFYYLCVKKTATRQEIVQMLWPDTNETSGRKSLREALYQIKKVFGPDCLEIHDRTHLAFHPDFPLRVDWDAVTPDNVLEYGDTGILSHFHVKNAYEFEEWTTQLQEEYNRMYIQAVQQRLYQADAQKDAEQIKHYSKILFKKDPYNEDLYYEAMDICAVNGHYNLALCFYNEMKNTFQQELGISPSSETSALYDRILHVKENLNVQEQSHYFYGRTAEIYQVSESISDFSLLPASPCLMFSGESGCGKSQLLEQSMHAAAGFSSVSLFTSCSPKEKISGKGPWLPIFQQLKQQGISLAFHESELEELSYWQLRNSLTHAFEALTARTPVVLFIDDIHWMELSSLLLLNRLICTFGVHKIRLICTCLTEYETEVEEGLGPMLQKNWLEIIPLTNFSMQETEEILSTLLPNLNFDPERRQSIYTLTEGNIRFLLGIIKIIQNFSI